jgi:hypothetical protein
MLCAAVAVEVFGTTTTTVIPVSRENRLGLSPHPLSVGSRGITLASRSGTAVLTSERRKGRGRPRRFDNDGMAITTEP